VNKDVCETQNTKNDLNLAITQSSYNNQHILNSKPKIMKVHCTKNSSMLS